METDIKGPDTLKVPFLGTMIIPILWLEKLRWVKWIAQGQLVSQGIESTAVGLPGYIQAFAL